jgi:hypothetical protein
MRSAQQVHLTAAASGATARCLHAQCGLIFISCAGFGISIWIFINDLSRASELSFSKLGGDDDGIVHCPFDVDDVPVGARV